MITKSQRFRLGEGVNIAIRRYFGCIDFVGCLTTVYYGLEEQDADDRLLSY